MTGYSQIPSRIDLPTAMSQQAYSQQVPSVMSQQLQHAVVSSQMNQMKKSPPDRTSVAIVAPMILEVDQNSKVQAPFIYNVNELLNLPKRSLQHNTMLPHSNALDSSAAHIVHPTHQSSNNQHQLKTLLHADTGEGVAARAHNPTHHSSSNQHKANTKDTAPPKQDSISQLGKAANMILKTKQDDIQTIIHVSNNTAAKNGKPEVRFIILHSFLSTI